MCSAEVLVTFSTLRIQELVQHLCLRGRRAGKGVAAATACFSARAPRAAHCASLGVEAGAEQHPPLKMFLPSHCGCSNTRYYLLLLLLLMLAATVCCCRCWLGGLR